MRVIVIHGTVGSPESNWFPWLKTELERLGVQVIVPRFPTPDDQNLEVWAWVLKESVGSLGAQDILVGHSIGASFVARILEWQDQPVAAAFVVAGFARMLGNPDFDPLIQSFVESPFDWYRVRAGAKKVFAYSGEDDPYVPLPFGLEIAGAIGAKLRVIPKGGHLNAEAGFLEFPLLLKDLRRCLKSAAKVAGVIS